MKPTSVVLVFDTLSGWSSLPHEGHNMLHINITSLKKCVLSPNILCSSGICDTHTCVFDSAQGGSVSVAQVTWQHLVQ